MKPIDDPSDESLLAHLRRAATLEDPPAPLVHDAINLWRAPSPSLGAAAASVLRRIEAVLGFDSWAAGSPAMALRSAATDLRQLVFTAQGRDVDLRIAPTPNGRYVVTGQVLGPDEVGLVKFERERAGGGDAAPVTAQLDSLGEFRVDGLDAGTWRVAVIVGNDEIALPPVEVGGRSR